MRITKMIDGHEVSTDDITVWINSGENGSSLARFTRYGVDVHSPLKPGEHQRSLDGYRGSGKGEVPETTREDWGRFCSSVATHHGVTLPDEFMPSRLEDKQHWLKTKYTDWQKVTKEKWLEAERDAGFRPKDGCGPYATSGFGGGDGGLEGCLTYDGKPPG